MDKDTKQMLKIIILYDIVIIFIASIISIIRFKEFVPIIIAGIIIAFINFVLNAVITNLSIRISGSAIFIIIGSVVRVFIAGAFAIILYNDNIINIVTYLIGYSLHYLSIILYGIVAQNNKREGE